MRGWLHRMPGQERVQAAILLGKFAKFLGVFCF